METIVEKYIQRVERAIDFGLDQKRWRDREISIMRTKLNQSVFNINGMSTPEVRMFLNELIDQETNYLEIGTHRGSTFVSAMYKNNPKNAIAIDDFGGPMHAPDIKNDFLKNCADNEVTKYKLIHNDSFRLKPNELESIKDINVYFYDGGHTENDHKRSLTYYYNCLSKIFIFVVDDWVHQPAVSGTLKAIEELNLKVHKKWELGHSQHIKNSPDLSWHNGLYIAVLEK